jgi:hypothetical protein
VTKAFFGLVAEPAAAAATSIMQFSLCRDDLLLQVQIPGLHLMALQPQHSTAVLRTTPCHLKMVERDMFFFSRQHQESSSYRFISRLVPNRKGTGYSSRKVEVLVWHVGSSAFLSRLSACTIIVAVVRRSRRKRDIMPQLGN